MKRSLFRKEKIFYLLALMLLSAVLLAACDLQTSGAPVSSGFSGTTEPKEQEVSYVLAFSGSYNRSRIPFSTEDFDENGEIAYTCKTRRDLLAFSDEYGFPFFDETDENYDSDLAQKVRGYDDAFFKTHSLVLLFKLSEEHDLSRFEGMDVKNGILTVTLASPSETGTVSPLNAFVYLIETPKSVAERVVTIETDSTEKGERSDYYGEMYNSLELNDLIAAGEISDADVMDMAYRYDGAFYLGADTVLEVPTDYEPQEKAPEPLSEETLILIYLSYLKDYKASLGYMVNTIEEPVRMLYNETVDEFLLDIATVTEYYGDYNGYKALKLTYDYSKLREKAPENMLSFLSDFSTFVLWKPAEK